MTALHSDNVEAPFVDEGFTDTPDSLVLDIGGDVGALILYAEESCLGQEIDLTVSGSARSHQMHTMIRRRRSLDRNFIAGVYPQIFSGAYTLWGLDGAPLGDVVIEGGQVAEFDGGSCRSRQRD
jgi:hypothetical protein